MDIVTFVKFALEIWQSDHNKQVFPNVGRAQSQGLSHCRRRADLGTGDLASFRK